MASPRAYLYDPTGRTGTGTRRQTRYYRPVYTANNAPEQQPQPTQQPPAVDPSQLPVVGTDPSGSRVYGMPRPPSEATQPDQGGPQPAKARAYTPTGFSQASQDLQNLLTNPVEDKNGRARSSASMAAHEVSEGAQSGSLAYTAGRAVGGAVTGLINKRADEELRRPEEIKRATYRYQVEQDAQKAEREAQKAQLEGDETKARTRLYGIQADAAAAKEVKEPKLVTRRDGVYLLHPDGSSVKTDIPAEQTADWEAISSGDTVVLHNRRSNETKEATINGQPVSARKSAQLKADDLPDTLFGLGDSEAARKSATINAEAGNNLQRIDNDIDFRRKLLGGIQSRYNGGAPVAPSQPTGDALDPDHRSKYQQYQQAQTGFERDKDEYERAGRELTNLERERRDWAAKGVAGVPAPAVKSALPEGQDRLLVERFRRVAVGNPTLAADRNLLDKLVTKFNDIRANAKLTPKQRQEQLGALFEILGQYK